MLGQYRIILVCLVVCFLSAVCGFRPRAGHRVLTSDIADARTIGWRSCALSVKKKRSIDEEISSVLDGATISSADTDKEMAKEVSFESNEISIEQKAKIKAEVSSPFRLLRKFLFGGAAAAGGLGIFTAVPQLFLAIQDGGDATTTAAMVRLRLRLDKEIDMIDLSL